LIRFWREDKIRTIEYELTCFAQENDLKEKK